MARLFLRGGADQYLESAAAPVTALPVTMACWFRAENIADNHTLLSLGDGVESRLAILANGTVVGDPLRIQAVNSAGTARTADTTTGFSKDTWHHACGVGVSATERHVYLDGGGKASNTQASTLSTPNRLTVGGRWAASVLGAFADARIAEIGVWNKALTDAQIAILATRRVRPTSVEPSYLVAYYSLLALNETFEWNMSPLSQMPQIDLRIFGAIPTQHPPGFVVPVKHAAYRVFVPPPSGITVTAAAGFAGAAAESPAPSVSSAIASAIGFAGVAGETPAVVVGISVDAAAGFAAASGAAPVLAVTSIVTAAAGFAGAAAPPPSPSTSSAIVAIAGYAGAHGEVAAVVTGISVDAAIGFAGAMSAAPTLAVTSIVTAAPGFAASFGAAPAITASTTITGVAGFAGVTGVAATVTTEEVVAIVAAAGFAGAYGASTGLSISTQLIAAAGYAGARGAAPTITTSAVTVTAAYGYAGVYGEPAIGVGLVIAAADLIDTWLVPARDDRFDVESRDTEFVVESRDTEFFVTEDDMVPGAPKLKDPDEVRDFTFNWEVHIGTDTIATSVITPAAGLTKVTEGIVAGGKKTAIRTSGGTIGQRYPTKNVVTLTTSGETLVRRGVIEVQQQ